MPRMGKGKQVLTPREYAGETGVAYTTVMNWLRKDLIPGVAKEEIPGGFYYQIPAGAPKPNLTPGPKPKASKKGGRK